MKPGKVFEPRRFGSTRWPAGQLGGALGTRSEAENLVTHWGQLTDRADCCCN